MSYRFMRVMILFDLPTVTSKNRYEYGKFHRYLVKNGFLMMQQSVYTKLALNLTAAQAIMSNIRKNKPASGLVQMLVVTEKQFSKMEFVLGEFNSDTVNSDERLIVL